MNAMLASKLQLLRARVESDVKLSSVIMVTSAQRMDGKSLTAYGLADSLAKVGHRAALVDMAVSPFAQRDGRSSSTDNRLFPVIPFPTDDSGPAASREAVKAFVDEMRANYDYTLIDAPPLMGSSVSMLLAGSVDAVLIALRHGRTPSEQDAVMVQTLKQVKAKVLGVIASSIENIREFETSRDTFDEADSRIVLVESRVDDVPTSSALFAK